MVKSYAPNSLDNYSVADLIKQIQFSLLLFKENFRDRQIVVYIDNSHVDSEKITFKITLPTEPPISESKNKLLITATSVYEDIELDSSKLRTYLIMLVRAIQLKILGELFAGEYTKQSELYNMDCHNELPC